MSYTSVLTDWLVVINELILSTSIDSLQSTFLVFFYFISVLYIIWKVIFYNLLQFFALIFSRECAAFEIFVLEYDSIGSDSRTYVNQELYVSMQSFF